MPKSRKTKKGIVQKPSGYWNLDRCKAEARKYRTVTEWKKRNGSSYTTVTRRGWLLECNGHMTRSQLPTSYWNLERCKAEALKYSTKKEWRANHKSSHSAATKKRWLEQCCSHMNQIRKPKGYWTLAKCKLVAKNFKTRSSWIRAEQACYQKASKMGWVEECCEHMERQGNRFNRQIYVFEHPDKSAYVGLAYNPSRRYKQHMHKNKVLIKLKKAGGQNFIIHPTFYPQDVAAQNEQKLIRAYKNKGWKILNKVRGGALGGSERKWTLEACQNEAKKYLTKREWSKKSHSSYAVACRQRWLQICCGHMRSFRKPKGYWTLKHCQEIAKKYTSESSWRTGDCASHGAAYKNGWLKKCCGHMIRDRKPRGHWTLERCKMIAKRYKQRSEWKNNHIASYDPARRRGWLAECCAHMRPGPNFQKRTAK